jgi:4-aminobutyrate aminotransferase
MGGGNVVKVPYPYPYRCLFGSTTEEECGQRYLDYIENYIFRTICPPEDTAGIIIEPVQSDGGDIVPPDNYFPGLEALCRKYGIMLLIDEVKVGFGRTGKMFGFQHWNVTPDAVAMGKSIGSGVIPLSAVVARKEILDVGTAINMYTVAGNPVSCTAGLATLDYIERHNLADNAREIGAYLLDSFNRLAEKHELIGDARGKGMILGVELVRDRTTKEPAATEAAKVVYRCKELGLIIFYGGIYSNVLEITPPLTMTRQEADQGLAIVDQALTDVEEGRFPDEKLGQYAGW